MYLQEVRLRNFKTYKTAKVRLKKGLNVVTGPNGSGKSNIVEAILFGLREFSPRALRASTFADLIRREPSGERNKTGYVALQFTGEDEQTVLKFKRKINESGRIDYYVNGKHVRRKDYVDSMLTLPEDPINHRYLAQGTIIKTAEMTPFERRKLLEDIVGLSVYDDKRNKAMERLEKADTKLSIAVAKIDEIRGNLITLYRESTLSSRKKLTDRYMRELTASIRTLETEDRLKTANQLQDRLDGKTKDMEKRRGEKSKLSRRIKDLRAEVKDLNVFLREKGGKELLELEKLRTQLKSELGRTNWQIDREKERVEGLINEETRTQEAADEVRKSLHLSHKEITSMEGEIEANERLIARLSEKKTQAAEELSSVHQQKEELLALSERKAAAKDSIFSTSVQKEAERRVASLRREIAELELDTAVKRLEILQSSEENMGVIIKRMRDKRSGELERSRELRKRIRSLEKRRQRIRKEIQEAEEVLHRARDMQRRINVKQELKDRLSKRVKDNRKVADVATRGLIPSVLGTLDQLIEGSKKDKNLCKIVCADLWNAIVVRDWEGAEETRELARKLKRDISVLVLSDYKGRPKEKETSDNRLLNKIKVEDVLRPMMEQVLEGTVVVDDIGEGLRLATSGTPVIDKEGQFNIRRGMLSVGVVDQESTLRSKKGMTMKDIEMALSNFSEMIKIRKKDIQDLLRETKKARKDLRSTEKALENTRGALRAFRWNLRALRRVSKTLEKRVKELSESLVDISETEERLDADMQELLGEVSLIEGQSKAEALSEFDERIGELEQLKGEVEHEISVLEITNESIRHRTEQIRQSIRNTKEGDLDLKLARVREIRGEIGRAKRRLTSRENRVGDLREQIADLGDKIVKLERKVSHIRERITIKEDDIVVLQREMTQLDKIIEELWSAVAEIREKRASVMGEVDKLKSEIENLGFKFPFKLRHPKYVRDLTEIVREENQRIGSVNPLARSSYMKRVSIYRRFSVRRNDLEEERNAILEFIDTIDAEKERLFLEAFSSVNERFTEIFKLMNPDGQAWLEIEDEEDVFNSGIAVMVQFPSKPMVEMTSLSGGEKSIVVVAFLLALQTVEKGAIYLFDEIDAHLDPANVERFVRVLKQSSLENQIIVITLKPSVAEVADNLMGVTLRGQKSRVIPMPHKMLVETG